MKEEHRQLDTINHKDLCLATQEIAKKRGMIRFQLFIGYIPKGELLSFLGGHVYNMVKNLDNHEYKNLRIHTINLCEKFLNRPLKIFEKEIFLSPRLCMDPNCREWRAELLSDCERCGQVS